MIPWDAARQASLSFTISWSLFKLTSFESVMPSDHVIPSFVPFSSFPQACPASGSFPTVVSMKLLFLKHVCLWKLLSDPCPFPNQVCEACFVLQILHRPTLTCINCVTLLRPGSSWASPSGSITSSKARVPQLSSTKPLGRCSIPVLSLFFCSSLGTPR